MKLLVDQNISPQFISNIKDEFPESKHVNELKINLLTYHEIWKHALDHDFVLVTTDSNFFNFSIVSEKAPKIIFIKGDVITSNKLEWTIRVNAESITHFVENDPSICLTIEV